MVFTVQTWKDEQRIHDDIGPVSHDAAVEIARAHVALGYTVRLIAYGTDYAEVYRPGDAVACGTLAQTTRVHGAA